MKRPLIAILSIGLLLTSLSGSLLIVQAAESSSIESFIGLSGYPTSTSQIDQILKVMSENGLNIYRMSFNPEWFSRKPHPYQANYIQYFLDNSDFTIIVDRNHIYPPKESGASRARDNWNIVENSIFKILERWPNNPRVAVELINEYVSDDFYPRMQKLVDDIRDAGYTNPIIVNKWNQPWTKIYDPIDNTYQGYHFYFNSWSLKGALRQMNIALSRGIKIINTEVGADFNEHKQFDTGEIKELSSFLAQCAELGVGNTIWLNENLNNWPRYESLNLNLPSKTESLLLISPSISPPSSLSEDSYFDMTYPPSLGDIPLDFSSITAYAKPIVETLYPEKLEIFYYKPVVDLPISSRNSSPMYLIR